MASDNKTPTLTAGMGTGGNNTPLIFNNQGGSMIKVEPDNRVGTLRAEAHGNNPIVLESNQNHATVTNNGICPTLSASMGMGGGYVPMVIPDKAGTLVAGYAKCYNDNPIERGYAVLSNKYIRRLTPLECERLQGLPDNWTLIDDKSCSDSARYKAIGNGMSQPCADYIIKRIVDILNRKE